VPSGNPSYGCGTTITGLGGVQSMLMPPTRSSATFPAASTAVPSTASPTPSSDTVVGAGTDVRPERAS